jgi:hypothetical protein
VRTVTWLLVAAALMAAAPHAAADTWRGTAPFCNGRCLSGEVEITRSKAGNGAPCWTGTKALCANSDPLCIPRETQVKCVALVLICDNGYLAHGDRWVSCATYACGACLFSANN